MSFEARTVATEPAEPPGGLLSDADPIWLLIVTFGLGLYWMSRLPSTNVERDWSIRGKHYRGRLTPAFLKKIKDLELLQGQRRSALREKRKARQLRAMGLDAGRDPAAAPRDEARTVARRGKDV